MLAATGRLWADRGFKAEILSTGDRPGDFAAELSAAGYPIHRLPFLRSPRFFWRLLRFFRRERFDAVHIHTERANSWYALAAFLTGHRAILRTVHAVFVFEGFLRVRRTVQRWIMRRLLGVTTTVPSRSVQSSEAATFRNPARIVPNWIDIDRFRPPDARERQAARTALGLGADRFVLVSVGNCAPVKNHAALIAGLALLPPDLPWTCLHVGAGDDEAEEQALAGRLGLAAKVRFLGRCDPRPFLWAADCFVMPSAREGFGLAAAEALACGLTCVLADRPGLRDFAPYADAILWADPTPPALAAAIAAAADPGRAGPGRTDDIAGRVRSDLSPARGVATFCALYATAPGAGCDRGDQDDLRGG